MTTLTQAGVEGLVPFLGVGFCDELEDRAVCLSEDGFDFGGGGIEELAPQVDKVGAPVGELDAQLVTTRNDRGTDGALWFIAEVRRQLQEPEIVTFDDVLARAEWALELAEGSEK